jgi:hypothetical protein
LDDQNDTAQLWAVIENTLILLRDNPINPDPASYLSLIYVAKLRPHIFAKENIWQARHYSKYSNLGIYVFDFSLFVSFI